MPSDLATSAILILHSSGMGRSRTMLLKRKLCTSSGTDVAVRTIGPVREAMSVSFLPVIRKRNNKEEPERTLGFLANLSQRWPKCRILVKENVHLVNQNDGQRMTLLY